MGAHNVTDRVSLAGKRAIVAIDFRHARVYATDTPGGAPPEAVQSPDPWHLDHNLYHRAGNVDGTYDIDRIDSDDFFKTLAHELAPAAEVLLLGHGKGKSNASHIFFHYLEKHYRDVAAKVVADIRIDIDDITDAQLERLGELYFGADEPVRDYSDGRWGTPRPGESRDVAHDLDNHHRDTLAAILDHPASGNVRWADVESLLGAVGTVEQRHDGKFKVTVGAETEVLSRPHNKDIDKSMIEDLRRMLRHAGYHAPAGGTEV